MRAILLAAGKGTRISRYLNGCPKCTVELGNGKRLIEYTVQLLKSKGITDITIVTGYKHNIIEELLLDSGIRFVYNPFYDVTNSIASLWFAKEAIVSDDLLIMSADVFAEECVYDKIINSNNTPVLAFDSSRREEADYKFFCPQGIVEKYGKDLTGEDISGEYVGFAVLRKSYVAKFLTKLDEMISEQKHSLWWENVLYELSESENIYVEDVNGMFWAEVDYIEDYNRIKQFIHKIK